MSKILGANDKREIEELEPINPKLGNPVFRIVDENSEFSPKVSPKKFSGIPNVNLFPSRIGCS